MFYLHFNCSFQQSPSSLFLLSPSLSPSRSLSLSPLSALPLCYPTPLFPFRYSLSTLSTLPLPYPLSHSPSLCSALSPSLPLLFLLWFSFCTSGIYQAVGSCQICDDIITDANDVDCALATSFLECLSDIHTCTDSSREKLEL